MNIKIYDLSAKNPNGRGGIEHKSQTQILRSIQEKESRIREIVSEIKKQL